jgi:hypothetical protein
VNQEVNLTWNTFLNFLWIDSTSMKICFRLFSSSFLVIEWVTDFVSVIYSFLTSLIRFSLNLNRSNRISLTTHQIHIQTKNECILF